jgi:hypothetical protein
MARCHRALALALILGACGTEIGDTTGAPDATSSVCTTSAQCGGGHWCNPKSVDTNPADTICEPRATTLQFDADIYPQLRDTCASCHVAGVPDPKDTTGKATLSVFAGSADVAFASLTGGGTDCTTTAHKLCVDEPKNGTAVARLIAHQNASGSALLLPAGYGDPWLQKLLHWTAGGAHRTNHDPDAGVPDAPVVTTVDAPLAHADGAAGTPDAPISTTPDAFVPPPPPDAPPPDARPPSDAPVDTTPPTGGNVTAATSDGCGVVTVAIQAATDNQTPANLLKYQVCVSSTSTGCMTNFTVDAMFNNAGNHTVDRSANEGATFFFAGRAVDIRGNASVPTEVHSVTIPGALLWAGGGVSVVKPSPGGANSYSVTWPGVSTGCASKPLTVQASCSGGSGCSCSVAGNQQSATCAANACDAITVTVTASAGAGSQNRAGSYVVHFAEVSPIFDTGGCRSCHDVGGQFHFGPNFSPADIGQTASVHCNANFIYVVRNDPASSMLYGVVSAHHWLCDPVGTNDHTFNTSTAADASLLFCWIHDGAQ